MKIFTCDDHKSCVTVFCVELRASSNRIDILKQTKKIITKMISKVDRLTVKLYRVFNVTEKYCHFIIKIREKIEE